MIKEAKMEMRTSILAFVISVFMLYGVIVVKDWFAVFLPVLLLYLLSFVALITVVYIGTRVFKLNFRFIFPLGVVLSLFVFLAVTSWLSGNNFVQTTINSFLNRVEGISMVDPWILGNLIAYILSFVRR